MNTTKAIILGFAAALMLTAAVQAITNCSAVEVQLQDMPEAFVNEDECSKREDKCNVAFTVRWHESFEREVLSKNGAAIWFWDHNDPGRASWAEMDEKWKQ